jgi:hypothetical protein
MNSLDHFQGVASLTRSLFELWLDLSILTQDATEAFRKYNEFPEIERYRVAEQLIRFASTTRPRPGGSIHLREGSLHAAATIPHLLQVAPPIHGDQQYSPNAILEGAVHRAG